ncbi:MAG TPA: ATP-binding protein, partial [Candidatus Krumholzibacterium sp.]|nr:ATP-binding protein [Candidatus Krumholzibacterium sp.]
IEATYGLAETDRDPEGVRHLLSLYPGDGPGLMSGRDLRGHSEDSPGTPGISSWVEALVFLGRDEECRGLIALGRKDMSNPYTAEDRDFLATVADQFMLTLDNLLMEQQVLESSRIESFNRFASFVIHDLKNTVGMLSLTAENARDNMEDRQFQLDAIETINRSVEKMRGLIHSLSAHKSPGSISRQRTDLRALADGRLKALSETASAKDVSLETAIQDDLFADVDPEAMERVIENLLLNAIEATHSGGSVDLEMGTDGRGGIYIRVADTGPGFDPSYLETRLFRPFSSTKKNGLGIGLVLCRTLVEAHGGTITIANTDGKGALVSIIIPTSQVDPGRKDPLQ